jgi:hypothetical protein
MSTKIVCDECGRVTYSAAGRSLLDSGYRCACGATPRIEQPEPSEPSEGAGPPGDEGGNGLPRP